jgi:hypothetical protein
MIIVDCSLSQELTAGETWIMAFEFELGEEERTEEVRNNIRELYTIISNILNRETT